MRTKQLTEPRRSRARAIFSRSDSRAERKLGVRNEILSARALTARISISQESREPVACAAPYPVMLRGMER